VSATPFEDSETPADIARNEGLGRGGSECGPLAAEGARHHAAEAGRQTPDVVARGGGGRSMNRI